MFGALVKTLLLTAQRKDKVTGMRWDDLANGEWTIRSEQREKGTADLLQLPQLALDVIEEQARQRRLAGNPYVFAGSLRGRRRANKPSGPPHVQLVLQGQARPGCETGRRARLGAARTATHREVAVEFAQGCAQIFPNVCLGTPLPASKASTIVTPMPPRRPTR